MPIYEYGENYEQEYESGEYQSEDSQDETEVNREALIAEEAFLGNYPFAVILDSVENQFRNYMVTEDNINYVDIFYSQLSNSYDAARTDNDDEEIIDILDELEEKFLTKMLWLFETCLGIGLSGYDVIRDSSSQETLTRAYEYFILAARRNFKVVISTSINATIANLPGVTEDNYLQHVNQLLMSSFNPIIFNVTPMEFLEITGDQTIITMFKTHHIVGNFLLRYTPKLIQHESYLIELINYITAHRDLGQAFKSEFIDQPGTIDPINKTEVIDHGV